MVFVSNGRGGGWHEPPHTWEEETEFYRRMNAGSMTFYRGPRKPADKQASTEQQQPGVSGQTSSS
jgi:hypothetical protein